MAPLEKYQNRTIAIYGMGMSGCSTARILKKLKAKIFCWDDSSMTRKKIRKLNFSINKFWLSNNKNSIDYIVISPGIDINKCRIKYYLKKNLKKIITDLDIFFELNKDSLIISITGTNGKSTTCKILEKILKDAGYNTQVGGNIGSPVLSLHKPKEKNIFILEISSYQIQYSKLFRSQHAAILNISPDHLDRHKNIKNYTKIKSRIFFAQRSTDYSYINSVNKYSKLVGNIFKLKKLKSKLVAINKSDCNFLLKKINNKYFKSKGNIENLAFAYRIVKNLKVNDETIVKAVNKFRGLPHRQEIIFSNKQLTCVNDSKATSFDACIQSLSNYNKIYWIVGGLPKYQDRFYLKNVSKRIVKAYIIGEHTAYFKKQIEKNIPYTVSNNLKNAIQNICNDIKKNNNSKNTILFSPAAASFDQFNNFEDRGTHFKNLAIKKIKEISNV